ncbi:MAG: hypothetical protein IKT93_01145 [Clostridia bacterium]|nr:hypothetical protein [Clostridia bacterium]
MDLQKDRIFTAVNADELESEDIIELDELYEQYTFLDGSPCGVENK